MKMVEFFGKECVDMDRVVHFWKSDTKVNFYVFGIGELFAINCSTEDERDAIYREFKLQTAAKSFN